MSFRLSIQGSSLQSFNNEIIKSSSSLTVAMEELNTAREELLSSIHQQEVQVRNLEQELTRVSDQLSETKASLEKKLEAKLEYDRLIQETENAYKKIVDSSRTLLEVIKKKNPTHNK